MDNRWQRRSAHRARLPSFRPNPRKANSDRARPTSGRRPIPSKPRSISWHVVARPRPRLKKRPAQALYRLSARIPFARPDMLPLSGSASNLPLRRGVQMGASLPGFCLRSAVPCRIVVRAGIVWSTRSRRHLSIPPRGPLQCQISTALVGFGTQSSIDCRYCSCIELRPRLKRFASPSQVAPGVRIAPLFATIRQKPKEAVVERGTVWLVG